ncbi:TniQ family protein [Acinetobacter baumannii]|uniref:TniQ family protein n=1 Tax=Acinetobacter baumannii TaxID=470 RepID=UPI00244ABCBF|nr:TniQ family protein [Acinetobacter baumannii]MDH2481219.1 TniQ family protein [Acinetobacter baumannii]MDH2502051.1 TniQ family protein [Acinetobacter baumannii]
MLLARPRIEPNECLVSYLIRISEKNGFKHIGHLLRHAGLAWKNNRVPVHQILTGEFDLDVYLLQLGLTTFSSKIGPISKSFQNVIDTHYLLVKYPKVCPDCIEEFGFCRFEWSLLPYLACVRHGKLLIDISGTGKRLNWYRRYLNKFDDIDVINSLSDVAPSEAIKLSQYIEELLQGGNRISCPEILQGLEFRESLSVMHFIAHYRSRLLDGSFQPLSMTNSELAQHYQYVWAMLENWPDAYYKFLNQYLEHPMSNKGVGGLHKHFRDLYESLHRQGENKGIARIKVEFDYYIEKYWPSVLESTRITRIQLTTRERNIVSKKEAAKILNCHPDRVDKLVQQQKLKPRVFEGKKHYSREQVEGLAIQIYSNWSMDEACEALQLTRYQLKQLLDAGILHTFQRPDAFNRDWIIDKAQCQELIVSLCQKARKSPISGSLSMISMQRRGYSIVRLVLAMQVGEIEFGYSHDVDHPLSCKQFTDFSFK